ncbi:MAG: GGDEF domain-containing protein [Oscillospiraceae bacterium]|nr:GGDEF domain-containing protein [Oscillospiraceae bacterium]
MKGFSFFYIEANLVSVIIFGIILIHNQNNIDRQEKQIKFDRVLLAFIVYFLADSVWAGIVDGVFPRSIFSIIIFLIYASMAAITYFWLEYVMAYEQVEHRNRPINRFAVIFPFLISTVLLVLNYMIAPEKLISADLETQPLFTLYLSAVPDIYMIAILFYTIRKARREENPVEKQKHIFIGTFPLMVSVFGLLGEKINPQAPTFCYASLILMLVFYIQAIELRVSQDPLTQLNNRGQLERYCAQRTNLYLEDRKTVVVMMDIDTFKAINDTYGHAEGDRALLIVSGALKTAVNSHSMPSFLCRYGGDEFILILHPVNVEETGQFLEEVRTEIRKDNCAYPLSISAGYDVLRDAPDTIQDCIRRADQKLYEEKASRK